MKELSVIIPVYNEEETIFKCLDSLLKNTFDKTNFEILVLDGCSTDKTMDVLKEISEKNKNIRVLTNENRFQVYAMNQGVTAAQGKYIIRCDAHSVYPETYLKNLVTHLKTLPDNVGNIGVSFETVPACQTDKCIAIAECLSAPFGVGISHRSLTGKQVIDVDTVLFGAWKKEIFEKYGMFDETFIRGQDYEHNYRLRYNGMKVLQVPGEKFEYVARKDIFKLLKMLYQYSHAKIHITKKYKKLPSIRSITPLLTLMGVPFIFFINYFFILYVLYFSLLLASAASIGLKRKKLCVFLWATIIFPSQHFAHALGMIRGIVDYYLFFKKQIKWNATR